MKFTEALEFCKLGHDIYLKGHEDIVYGYYGDGLIDDTTIKMKNPNSPLGYEFMTNLAATMFIEENAKSNSDDWMVNFKDSSINGKEYSINNSIFKAIQYNERNFQNILNYFGIDSDQIRKSLRVWDELYPQRVSFIVPETKDVLIFKIGDYIILSPKNTYFVLTEKVFNVIFSNEEEDE